MTIHGSFFSFDKITSFAQGLVPCTCHSTFYVDGIRWTFALGSIPCTCAAFCICVKYTLWTIHLKVQEWLPKLCGVYVGKAIFSCRHIGSTVWIRLRKVFWWDTGKARKEVPEWFASMPGSSVAKCYGIGAQFLQVTCKNCNSNLLQSNYMLTHSRKLATNHYIHEGGKGRKVIDFFNTPTDLRNTLKSAEGASDPTWNMNFLNKQRLL